ncbi:MAG: hypothetical protein FWE24_02645 [Defluviitaleaceae bacterium]|nr:hypothetical protein [Defluviitaleaceae bacterium]
MNIERKLKNFAKMAEDEALKTRQVLIGETERHVKDSLEKTKKEAVEVAEKALEAELSKLKQIQKREIVRYESEARKKLIMRREEILEELKYIVEKDLLEYVESPEYREWLSKAIQDEMSKNPAAIISEENCSDLGGYKLISANGKKVVDNTFAARLLEALENFQGFTALDFR